MKALKKQPARRVPVSLRVTPEMKDKLEAAAAKSGRSLTQEMELRLEQSFLPTVPAEIAGMAFSELDKLGKKLDQMDKTLDVLKADAKRRVEELERFGAQKGWEKRK